MLLIDLKFAGRTGILHLNHRTTQTARIPDPSIGLTDYQDCALTAMENCDRALKRIEEGLALLQSEPNAAIAFQFMNCAMWQQRIHSIYAEQKRQGKDVELESIDIPKNRSWRPFQLAFILLNLPSITDLHHEERSHPTDVIAEAVIGPSRASKEEVIELGLLFSGTG